MKLLPETIYHIYNQGNNRQKIFFDRKDYLTFLKLYKTLIAPYCETLSYCLMPNHFHFLTYTTPKSIEEQKLGAINIQGLSNAYRVALSKYAQIINEKEQKSGSLFRQKTKAKEIIEGQSKQLLSYSESCFYYIHQNPVKALLCKQPGDWEFSSYRDYTDERSGTLCNKELTATLLGWPSNYKLKNDFDIDDATERTFFE